MNWLLLYFDIYKNEYTYQIFNDLNSVLSYRDNIFRYGITQKVYCYKLYGRCNK